jgi:hypothetical protein
MKRAILFLVVLSVLILTTAAWAFQSWGRTNYQYLEYSDLVRDGDGYNITLLNRHQSGIVEIYVIVHGTDIHGNVVYRQRFYVDFIPGNGQVGYWLPGYNNRIFDMRIMIKKIPEVDTLPRY